MDLPREPDMISEFRRRTIQWLGDAEKNARRKNCEERVQEWVPHIYIYIYIYDISRLRVKNPYSGNRVVPYGWTQRQTW